MAMEEKRKYPRFDLAAKIQFKKIKDINNLKDAFVKNISAEGFCFSCDNPLKVGEILQVEILEDIASDIPLYVKAEVVWSQDCAAETKKNSFLIGVKVLGIRVNDEARFAMLYCERIIAELRSLIRK